MKLHILSNKMHKNVMLIKLLNYALKVVLLDRAVNRTPLTFKSNALPKWLCRYTTSDVIIIIIIISSLTMKNTRNENE